MYVPTQAEQDRHRNTLHWRSEQRQRLAEAWRPPTPGTGRQQRRREEMDNARERLAKVAGKERRRLLREMRERSPNA